MTWRWHVLGGVVAYSVALLGVSYFCVIKPEQASFWFFLTIFGALFPDIDTKSTIRGFIYGKWLLIMLIILVLLNVNTPIIVAISLLCLLPLVVRHRGLFHSKVILIAVPIGLAVAGSWYFSAYAADFSLGTLFFIAGTVSHLALDFCHK